MRRHVASWIFAIFVGGLSASSAASPSAAAAAESGADAPAVVQQTAVDLGIRDEAAMVLVGTFLIGLAGAVRRAA
jgi:hypothetical protein